MSPVHAFLEPLDPPPGEDPELSVPTSPEQLRQAAYDDGYERGLSEGARRRAMETGDALAQLQADIDSIAFDLHSAQSRFASTALELTREILEKTLPTLCQQGFGVEVLPLIKSTLDDLPAFDLTISVPDDLVETVRREISISGKKGAITVTALGDGEKCARAELAWSNGRVNIDLDRVTQEVLAKLQAHITRNQEQMNRSDHDGS
jgi:hypothetical protein